MISMQEEVKRWWGKAKGDLEKAEILFDHKKYDGTVFFCQQAVEKSLKVISLKEKKTFKKIHDLVELGKDIRLPEKLLDYCKELTPAYVYARYPDVAEEENIPEIAKKFLQWSKEVMEWVEKRL